jgi:hypothetical protein
MPQEGNHYQISKCSQINEITEEGRGIFDGITEGRARGKPLPNFQSSQINEITEEGRGIFDGITEGRNGGGNLEGGT